MARVDRAAVFSICLAPDGNSAESVDSGSSRCRKPRVVHRFVSAAAKHDRIWATPPHNLRHELFLTILNGVKSGSGHVPSPACFSTQEGGFVVPAETG
jgi:hypothetical protein